MTNALINAVGNAKPRREACLFSWDELKQDQQLAVLKAHRLVCHFAARPIEERLAIDPTLPFLPPIDPMPINRVVLIDGRRGSGKTVVLLKLMDHWRTSVLHLAKPGQTAAGCREEQSAFKAVQPKGMEFNIVPIGSIGLQLVSKTAKLLPFLAGYFHRVLQAIVSRRGGSGQKQQPAWMPVEDSSLESAARWKSFYDAAAFTWNSNLDARNLDPEAYVLELREAELRRRDVTTTYTYFQAFMDALVQDYTAVNSSSGGAPPLFVLAIDDADMQPDHTVRLVEALRLLDHQRVAFVLTGDSNLFLHTLANDLVGRRRRPLRELDMDEGDEREDRRFASALARDIYDKAVPLAHRIGLPPLPPEDRLAELKGALDARTIAAEHLLGDESPGAEYEQRSLLYYLQNDDVTPNALPDRLRALIAFRESVESTRMPDNDADAAKDSALPVVVDLWHDALDSATLTPQERDELRRIVRIDKQTFLLQGSSPQHKPAVSRRLVVESYRLSGGVLSRVITPRRRLADGWTFVLRDIAGYRLVFERRTLPDDVAAAFMLATDVAADAERGDLLGAPLSPNEFAAPFTMVQYESDDMGGIEFNWPVPDWDSFVDFQLFARCWRDSVRRRAGGKGERHRYSIGLLAREFLDLIVSISRERKAPQRPSPEAEPPSWGELAGSIKKLETSPRDFRRDRTIGEWARTRAMLMAAPESGLDATDANEWYEALQSHSSQASLRRIRSWKAARRERARAALFRSERNDATSAQASAALVTTLLREIDAGCSEYLLVHALRPRAPARIARKRPPGAVARP